MLVARRALAQRPMAVADVATLYGWYLQDPSKIYADDVLPESWLYGVQADASQLRWSFDLAGQLVALGTLWPNRGCGPGVVSPTVLVHPERRGQGIGSQVLATLVGQAHAWPDATELRAGVYHGNDASYRMARRLLGDPVEASQTASGLTVYTFARRLR